MKGSKVKQTKNRKTQDSLFAQYPGSSSPFQFPDKKLSPSYPNNSVSLSKQINFPSFC
jgi:hypothetical protein